MTKLHDGFLFDSARDKSLFWGKYYITFSFYVVCLQRLGFFYSDLA